MQLVNTCLMYCLTMFIACLTACGGVTTSQHTDAHGRVGATVPFTTLEAEDARRIGGAIQNRDKQIGKFASGLEYVDLVNVGDAIEFVNVPAANRLTVRFNLKPEEQGTLTLYKNGHKYKTLEVDSEHCYAFNPKHHHPRHFAETSFVIDVAKGDTLRLQKDADNRCSHYGIDLVDLEMVGKAIPRPRGFLSITDFGAVPDDGKDDTDAIAQAMAAAAKEPAKGVYFPAGTFQYQRDGSLPKEQLQIRVEQGVTMQGAGMWHTTLYCPADAITHANADWKGVGCFKVVGDDVTIRDIRFEGNLTRRGRGAQPILIGSVDNVLVERCWITRFNTAIWNGNGTRSNITLRDNRVIGTYADALHFAGARDVLVENNFMRGCGDDAIAIIGRGTKGQAYVTNAVVRYNSSIGNYHGRGTCLGGTKDVQYLHNFISSTDTGLLLETGGNYDHNAIHETLVKGNLIANCGQAVRLNVRGGEPMDARFENNRLVAPYRVGIFAEGNSSGRLVLVGNQLINSRQIPAVSSRNEDIELLFRQGNSGF